MAKVRPCFHSSSSIGITSKSWLSFPRIMKPSTRRALIYLAVLVIGYAIGFFDGAPPEAPMAVGPLLLLFIIGALLLCKIAAWLALKWKQGRNGSSGSGFGPFPCVPRSPTGRPPILTARETF